MSSAPVNIVLVPQGGLLAGLGLEADVLAQKAGELPGAAEVRLIEGWGLEELGEVGPESRLILVGRAEPLAGLSPEPAGQVLVDLAGQMPWLAGEPQDAALALIGAAVAEAELARDLPRQKVEVFRRVLVWGEGPAAERAVSTLAGAGFEVCWARPEAEARGEAAAGVEVRPGVRLAGLEGFAGRFTARLERNGTGEEVRVGAVVLCGQEKREALGPGQGVEAVTLSAFEAVLEGEDQPEWAADKDFRVVFLAGVGRASTAGNMGRIMSSALRVRTETRAAVYVLAPQVKVAGPGLERLYGQARQAGVVFLRPPLSGPGLRPGAEGRTGLRVQDPLARAELSLTPDLVVLEEALSPEEGLLDLARQLGLSQGPDGFVAPDNVLFLAEATNRRGVLALGPARGTDDPEILAGEVGAALDEVARLLDSPLVQAERLAVDKGRCTICLTCLRLCPHQALGFTNRPWADPLACAECGLCAAECPMDALQLEDYTDAQVKARLGALLARPRWGEGFVPRLVCLACRRSGGPAAAAAPRPEAPLDLALIPLPCAGRVEDDLVFSAFLGGADGVLVATCHEDNCRTQHGSLEARRRLEYTRVLLAEAGLEPERVKVFGLAPNMGADFAREVLEFSAEIKRIGPNPLFEDKGRAE